MTYDSYEAAKIANPDSDIYPHGDRFTIHGAGFTIHGAGGLITGGKCNPADYCMTVEKFLADGHKFVEGDFFINHDCEIVEVGKEYESGIVVSSHEANAACASVDARCYILRAAALEEKPSEKAEWVNGDECEIEMQEGVRRYLFGCECPNNQQTCIVFTKDGGGHMVMPIERLSKPETKKQREERERLENGKAFYELMSEIEISIMNPEANGHPNQWDELRNEWQQVYILQAEKLNYRKDMK